MKITNAGVLVDSSVWIEYFRSASTLYDEVVDDLLLEDRVVLGDLVLHEVLRGVRSQGALEIIRQTMTRLACHDMLGYERANRSAARYRDLRTKGITVRKVNDAIIASFCLDEGYALLTADRDFRPYAEHLGLQLAGEPR